MEGDPWLDLYNVAYLDQCRLLLALVPFKGQEAVRSVGPLFNSDSPPGLF
jgi:hypothetical protein